MSQGKSLALSQNTFLKPPSEDQEDREYDYDASLGRQRRLATVYDAVAGLYPICRNWIFLSDSHRPCRFRRVSGDSTIRFKVQRYHLL